MDSKFIFGCIAKNQVRKCIPATMEAYFLAKKENPNIVEVYKKYKDSNFKNGKGFTVLSVSLDFKQEAWEKAIEADLMEWSYHVGDLKGWRNAAAQEYKVKSIPTSYLIDGDGVIVGINLRGDSLESTLKKIRKKKSFFSSKD